MENNRKALGRGLEQLFSNERIDFENVEKEIIKSTKEKDILEIPLIEVRRNPYQPRKKFNEETLNELAESIKEHGIVQPIIVKKSIKGYDLIAGERRCKAAKLAGLKTIPAIVKEFTDDQMMEIALIENIQRENLNVLEEALAYGKILEVSGITQEALAKKFGKSRSYITNLLGLLSLPSGVKSMIDRNEISMSHARVLSKLEDNKLIVSLAERIISEGLSVRDIEKVSASGDIAKKKPINKDTSKSARISICENALRDLVGTKVVISKNKITIPFDSEPDLLRILEILKVNVDGE